MVVLDFAAQVQMLRGWEMKFTALGSRLAYATVIVIGCNPAPHTVVSETEEEASLRPVAKLLDDRPQTAFESLKGYQGKELAKLDALQFVKLLDTISTLIPNRKESASLDNRLFVYSPWYFWKFSSVQQSLFLLFEVDDTRPHPGSTRIRITAFNNTGIVQSVSEFNTGHRCYIHRAYVEIHGAGQEPMVIIETSLGPGPGPDLKKQIYAQIGDRFDIVRLESADGMACRNNYYVRHFACGPDIPKQTQLEWEADILSGNEFQILRALVWLGGVHWKGRPDDESEKQHEASEQIRLVRCVRESQRVADKLKKLSASEIHWLREAATLASDPEDRRW